MNDNVEDVMKPYDEVIDDLVDDSKGFHDTVTRMKDDVINHENQARQVISITRGSGKESSVKSESPQQAEQHKAIDIIRIVTVVPPCRRSMRVEAIQQGRVVASKPTDPSRRSRRVVMKIPKGKTIFRLIRSFNSKVISVNKSGIIDMRP